MNIIKQTSLINYKSIKLKKTLYRIQMVKVLLFT